jgi:hypothetical protein
MTQEIKCEKCGRSISDETGQWIAGCCFLGSNAEIMQKNLLHLENIHPELMRLKNLYGKLDFYICVPCFLEAMGIKLNKEKSSTIESKVETENELLIATLRFLDKFSEESLAIDSKINSDCFIEGHKLRAKLQKFFGVKTNGK